MKKLLKMLGMGLLVAGATIGVALAITGITKSGGPRTVPLNETEFLSSFAITKDMTHDPQAFPEARFVDMDEKPHSLADYRGKKLLINFWAGWCAPCRKELPALERLRKAAAGPDFDVLYVSVDNPENGAALKDSMKNLGAGIFPSFYTKENDLWSKLDITALPVTYLVDGKGRITYMLAGDGPWDSQPAKDFIANLPR
jgi:thiol-disulfide isomerase/thioredoxin